MQKRTMNKRQYAILMGVVATLILIVTAAILIWKGHHKVPQTPLATQEKVTVPENTLPAMLPIDTDPQVAKASRGPRNIISGHYLMISKSKHLLGHYLDGKLLHSYPVAIGTGEGDKGIVNDMMTPEGHFTATKIKDSSTFTYDFGDGKGETPSAYGPWYIVLVTDRPSTFSKEGWSGIGIHGTHDESSIGKNVTHGCVRLRNKDLIEMVNQLETPIQQSPIPVDIIP